MSRICHADPFTSICPTDPKFSKQHFEPLHYPQIAFQYPTHESGTLAAGLCLHHHTRRLGRQRAESAARRHRDRHLRVVYPGAIWPARRHHGRRRQDQQKPGGRCSGLIHDFARQADRFGQGSPVSEHDAQWTGLV